MTISIPCIPNVGADAVLFAEELDRHDDQRQADNGKHHSCQNEGFERSDVLPEFRDLHRKGIEAQGPDDNQGVEMGPEGKGRKDTEKDPVCCLIGFQGLKEKKHGECNKEEAHGVCPGLPGSNR